MLNLLTQLSLNFLDCREVHLHQGIPWDPSHPCHHADQVGLVVRQVLEDQCHLCRQTGPKLFYTRTKFILFSRKTSAGTNTVFLTYHKTLQSWFTLFTWFPSQAHVALFSFLPLVTFDEFKIFGTFRCQEGRNG